MFDDDPRAVCGPSLGQAPVTGMSRGAAARFQFAIQMRADPAASLVRQIAALLAT